MKLSAPPPPPSDGAPGTPDGQPKPDPTAAPGTPVADAPGSPSPATGPKLAAWPAWYSGVDSALVGLVVAFAFVAASFVARNSDMWIHLAAGKRLFAGEYFPGGSDPFSYAAEGRTWVNHSWLTDAVAYLLYGGTGKVLVGAKAVVVALAFATLIAIRRPKFALWPWAACACVGVLAAAPQFTLRPLVVSMLLLAVTLYLLFRMPQKKDSWRFPGAIGVTFWVWANCDQWFFVGPLALALLILGDLVQKYGFNTPDEPLGDPDAEPLGRLPDTATLAKALGIGLLACMLTPHHIRIWELPFEMTGASGVEADPRLRQMLLAPHDNLYLNNASLGYNANGLAYAILFVAGAAAFGVGSVLGVGRVRIAHVALWLGFGVLSLLSVYAIPFFALVAVPLVAAQLNAFSANAELKTWGDRRTRLLLIGSSGGRVLSVVAISVLCVLAYPGWVHPDTPVAAYARRVAWAVEPEPGMVQAAEQLQQWHTAGTLGADARGFITNTDLANYAAWYAPAEKVFVNSRFRHHRRDLADFVAVRKGLGLIRVGDEVPNPKDATDVLTRLNAEYVALYAGAGDNEKLRLLAQLATFRLFQWWGEWSAWYTDGRTAIFGWRPTPAGGKPSFAALRLDPVSRAFGAGVKKAPDPTLQAAPTHAEADLDKVVEAFVRPPKPAPPGAAEALGWVDYKQALRDRQRVRAVATEHLFFYGPATQHSFHSLAVLGPALDPRRPLQFPPRHADSDTDAAAMRALPLLAVRAARRAIAEEPDHPDAYYALAQALRDADLPLTESERALGIVVALRQCLDRVPPPERYRRGQFAVFATRVSQELAAAYLGASSTWRDPVTKKETTAHFGFPANIPALGDLLGQLVLISPQGQARLVPALLVGQELARSPQGTQVYANGTPHILAIDLAREALNDALKYADIDTAGGGGESAQAFKKEVQSQLKGLENEEVTYRQRFESGRRPETKLPDLVDRAIFNCMIGTALELLNRPDVDLAKEYGPREALAALRHVALEIAAGQIENADFRFTGEKGLNSAQSAAAIERAGLSPRAQLLKYQKALHAGEYRAAGQAWESLNPTVGQADKLPPPGSDFPLPIVLNAIQATQGKDPAKALLAMLTPPLVPTPGHAQIVQLHFWFTSWVDVSGAIRQGIAAQLSAEAEFFYRRGVLLLLEGDIPAAKDRFKQSRREPPPGWRLSPIVYRDANGFPAANAYLALIEYAEKGK